MEIGSSEARARLGELLRLAQTGERITITRRGEPVALLVRPTEVATGGALDESAGMTGPASLSDPV